MWGMDAYAFEKYIYFFSVVIQAHGLVTSIFINSNLHCPVFTVSILNVFFYVT